MLYEFKWRWLMEQVIVVLPSVLSVSGVVPKTLHTFWHYCPWMTASSVSSKWQHSLEHGTLQISYYSKQVIGKMCHYFGNACSYNVTSVTREGRQIPCKLLQLRISEVDESETSTDWYLEDTKEVHSIKFYVCFLWMNLRLHLPSRSGRKVGIF
jgi:hypothetical protein